MCALGKGVIPRASSKRKGDALTKDYVFMANADPLGVGTQSRIRSLASPWHGPSLLLRSRSLTIAVSVDQFNLARPW